MPARHLVQETAYALADFVNDDASLLIACRRVLDRQPAAGPLVWLAAHALGAPDASKALWSAAEEIDADKTAAALAYALDDDPTIMTMGWSETFDEVLRLRGDVGAIVVDVGGDLEYQLAARQETDASLTVVDASGAAQAVASCSHVLVEVDALGPHAAVARQGALGVCATARLRFKPVWAIAPTGTTLADKMFGGLTRRWHEAQTRPLWERALEEIETELFDQVCTNGGLTDVAGAVRASGCPIVPELF